MGSHFRERIQHTLVFMGQILGNTVSDSRKYYEQPAYSVLQTYDGFELREYEGQKWTSCSVPDSGSPKTNGSVGFRKLFQYITGRGNEENPSVITDPMAKSEFYVRSFSPPSGDYSHYQTNIT